MAYKAEIEFLAYEDDYNEGEVSGIVNSWNQTITADTKANLRNEICDATYSKWEDIDGDQMNEYDHATEYHTSYLANEDNQGDASESEIEEWKKGELKLYAINCHILVTEVTEQKASL